MLFRSSSSTNIYKNYPQLIHKLIICLITYALKVEKSEMYIIILFFLSVVSCPREAIITQIIKSLVTKLQNTVNLTVEHHTVIAGVARNKTSKENWPIEALLQGDTLQSA